MFTSNANMPDDGSFGAGMGSGSRPSSRAGFRRPGEEREGFQTPGGGGGGGRLDQLRQKESGTPSGVGRSGAAGGSGGSKVSTPIPSVFTPQNLARSTSGYPFPTPSNDAAQDTRDPTSSAPPLSTEELNKLQAKVLRAKLMDDPAAQNLEEEYEYERNKSQAAADGHSGLWEGGGEGGQMGREVQLDEKGRRVEVQVLPTLDGRGRLYDIGGVGAGGPAELGPGNKRKKVDKVSKQG